MRRNKPEGSIEVLKSTRKSCKDDSDPNWQPRTIDLLEDQGKRAGNHKYLIKSVWSADDVCDVIDVEMGSELERTYKRDQDKFFNPIFEDEKENDETVRATMKKQLEYKERTKEADSINFESYKREEDNSINGHSDTPSSHKDSLLKPWIKGGAKQRQLSHQTVDIAKFRENLKSRHTQFNRSLGPHDDLRHDVEGNVIEHGGHYKIKFADEIKEEDEERKHSLATTHYVESYKKYNAPTWGERCWNIL